VLIDSGNGCEVGRGGKSDFERGHAERLESFPAK
jgi:hypothetical protein